MLFLENGKIQLGLDIEGYQYSSADEVFDANWLNVIVNVRDITKPRGFKMIEPCLLTWELASLSDWFCMIKKDFNTKSSLEFIEPNLSFTFADGSLSVILDHELNLNVDREEAYIVVFELDDDILTRLIGELQSLIAQFPELSVPVVANSSIWGRVVHYFKKQK